VASLLGEGKDERIEDIEVGATQKGVVHVRRLEDGMIAAVPTAVAAALLPDPIALRAKKVLDLSTDDMHAIPVSGPPRPPRFERPGRGPWPLVEPKGEGLSPDAGLLSDLAHAVAKLSADRWVGAAQPVYGLDHPRLTIAVDLTNASGSRTVEIALGTPSGTG